MLHIFQCPFFAKEIRETSVVHFFAPLSNRAWKDKRAWQFGVAEPQQLWGSRERSGKEKKLGSATTGIVVVVVVVFFPVFFLRSFPRDYQYCSVSKCAWETQNSFLNIQIQDFLLLFQNHGISKRKTKIFAKFFTSPLPWSLLINATYLRFYICH